MNRAKITIAVLFVLCCGFFLSRPPEESNALEFELVQLEEPTTQTKIRRFESLANDRLSNGGQEDGIETEVALRCELAPKIRLVAGNVVDVDGNGIPNVLINGRLPRLAAKGRRSTRPSSQSQTVVSDAQGAFSFLGPSTVHSMVLSFHSENHFGDAVALDTGTLDARITLGSLATLAAQIETRKELKTDGWFIHLTSQVTQKKKSWACDFDGHFEESLPSGLYSFSVTQSRHSNFKLYEQHDLFLAPGQRLDLGRIVIEAADKRLVIHATFEGATDDFGVGGLVTLLSSQTGKEPEHLHVFFNNEPITVWIDELPIVVEMEIDGFRKHRFVADNHLANVFIRRGFEVSAHLEQQFEDQRLKFQVQLISTTKGGHGQARWSQCVSPTTAKASITTSIAGRYGVRVFAHFCPDGETVFQQDVTPEVQQVMTVTESDGVQKLLLKTSADKVALLSKRIKKYDTDDF